MPITDEVELQPQAPANVAEIKLAPQVPNSIDLQDIASVQLAPQKPGSVNLSDLSSVRLAPQKPTQVSLSELAPAISREEQIAAHRYDQPGIPKISVLPDELAYIRRAEGPADPRVPPGPTGPAATPEQALATQKQLSPSIPKMSVLPVLPKSTMDDVDEFQRRRNEPTGNRVLDAIGTGDYRKLVPPAPSAKPAAPITPESTDQDLENAASESFFHHSDQIGRGAARALGAFVSPESLDSMAMIAMTGRGLAALANAPKLARALRNAPEVLKALDVAAGAAVPAAVAGYGGAQLLTQPAPSNLEEATETAINALILGAGTIGAIKAGKSVLSRYAAEISGNVRMPGGAEVPAKSVGVIPEVDPRQAAANAAALESQGQNLAAMYWNGRNLNAPTEFSTTAGRMFLQPAQIIKKAGGKVYRYESVLDADGNLVVGGTPETVRLWLEHRKAKVNTYAAVPGAGGAPLIADVGTVQTGESNLKAAPGTFQTAATALESDAPTPPVTQQPLTPVQQAANNLMQETLGFNPMASGTEPASPQLIPDIKAFQRAKAAWRKQTYAAQQAWEEESDKRAVAFMEANPGVTWEDAKAATADHAPAPQAGAEPRPEDFKTLAPPPKVEPVKEVKPDKTRIVTNRTNNAATAATGTTPESPETIAIQVAQLGAGLRRVVMFPIGPNGEVPANVPDILPKHVARTSDKYGNLYAYNTDMTNPEDIKKAAHSNKLTEILGHEQLGMGAPDKTMLQGDVVVVVVRDANGVEVQSTATDEAHLEQTTAASQALMPEGGSVGIETAEQAVGGRTQAPAGIQAPGRVGGVPNAVAARDAQRLADATQAIEQAAASGQKITGQAIQRQFQLGYGAAERLLQSFGLDFLGNAVPEQEPALTSAGAKILDTIQSPEADGLTARIAEWESQDGSKKGFSVAFQDPESGEFLPDIRTAETLEQARQIARKALGIRLRRVDSILEYTPEEIHEYGAGTDRAPAGLYDFGNTDEDEDLAIKLRDEYSRLIGEWNGGDILADMDREGWRAVYNRIHRNAAAETAQAKPQTNLDAAAIAEARKAATSAGKSFGANYDPYAEGDSFDTLIDARNSYLETIPNESIMAREAAQDAFTDAAMRTALEIVARRDLLPSIRALKGDDKAEAILTRMLEGKIGMQPESLATAIRAWAGPGDQSRTVNLDAKLPAALSKADPRYGYGEKQFLVRFGSDLDRAAYITAQKTPSPADAEYLKFVMDATGATEEDVRQHGLNVRAAIKAQAKDAPALDEDGKQTILAVTDMARGRFGEKPAGSAVPAPRPVGGRDGGMAEAGGAPVQPPEQEVASEYAGVPLSVLSAFPSMISPGLDLIPLSNFTQTEQAALRSAGLVEIGTSKSGEYEGVDSEKLWPLRSAASDAGAGKTSTHMPAPPTQFLPPRPVGGEAPAPEEKPTISEDRAQAIIARVSAVMNEAVKAGVIGQENVSDAIAMVLRDIPDDATDAEMDQVIALLRSEMAGAGDVAAPGPVGGETEAATYEWGDTNPIPPSERPIPATLSKNRKQLKTPMGDVEILTFKYGENGEIAIVALSKGAGVGKAGGGLGRAYSDKLQDLGYSQQDVVGTADITPNESGDGGFHSEGTYVDKGWQRQGIASAMYDQAEAETGRKLNAASVRTNDGDALQRSRGGVSVNGDVLAPVAAQPNYAPDGITKAEGYVNSLSYQAKKDYARAYLDHLTLDEPAPSRGKLSEALEDEVKRRIDTKLGKRLAKAPAAPAKASEAAPARQLKGWIGEQSPERQAAIREVLRDIFDEGERARQKNRDEVKAMGNALSVGGDHMDSLFRAEAIEGFRGAVWEGKNLQQAVDTGVARSNEAIKKWNEQRKKDYVVHRGIGQERSHLEGLARRVAAAGDAPAHDEQQQSSRASSWEGRQAPDWWGVAFGTDAITEPWETVRDAYVKRVKEGTAGQTMMDYAGDWATGKAEAGADRQATTQVEAPTTEVGALSDLDRSLLEYLGKTKTSEDLLYFEGVGEGDQGMKDLNNALASLTIRGLIDRKYSTKGGDTKFWRTPEGTKALREKKPVTPQVQTGVAGATPLGVKADATQADILLKTATRKIDELIEQAETTLRNQGENNARAVLDQLSAFLPAARERVAKLASSADGGYVDRLESAIARAEAVIERYAKKPAARAAQPSAERFDELSKELAAIEKSPEYRQDTEAGRNARESANSLNVDIAFHRPAAIARAQAEIDAEKEAANAESNRLPEGSAGKRDGAANPEALAGVSPVNVQGAGGQKAALPVSDERGDSDGENAGGVATGQPAVRPGGGDRVPGVVSTPERGRPAQPDLQSGNAPTGTNSDFSLTPEQAAEIEAGGAKTKARNNLEAIRAIKAIQADGNRAATLEEQNAIAKYVGWGDSEMAQGIFQNRSEWAGIRREMEALMTPAEFEAAKDSTINAHYTRRDLARAMWDVARHFGFKSGSSVIEPGMGIGNFFMMMPEDLREMSRRTGVEMDLLTGAMARAMYPSSNIVIKPYQETNLPDGYFDLAIGNVPFAQHVIYDPAFKRNPSLTMNVHNYFFAKTVEKLRPGGVALLITSRYTMDGKDGKTFRKLISDKAEFLGAVRLPRNTFKANAGTSVTVDVIAIRKRLLGEEPVSKETWVETNASKMSDGETMYLNEYFIRHPEMMMGEMKGGTMNRFGHPELFGEFSLPAFSKMMQSLPGNVIPEWTVSDNVRGENVENYPDASHIKDHQYAIVNGALVLREGARFVPVTLTGKKLERVKGLIELRGAAREVIRTQYIDAPEAEILKARKDLNKVYDAFVEKLGGPVNSLGNVLVFASDPDWPLLSALENYDKEKKTAVKRDIFDKRTIQKPQPVERVETAPEALAVSLNELGRVDWDRMQSLTGRHPDELQKELTGKIYQNPVTRKWETAEEYLSGNVRKKLTDATFAANDNPRYQDNVEALAAIQPKDLEVGEVDAALGNNWIRASYIGDFIEHLLKVENPQGNSRVKPLVTYLPSTGTYAIRDSNSFADAGVANRTEHGTPYFTGLELVEGVLNGQAAIAYDTETDPFTGSEIRVKNKNATIESTEKQQRISDAFSKWIWSDAGRTADLLRTYNDERNNIVLRNYNGSHLQFPGLNRSWLRGGDLDQHQKDAVWRIIQNGNTLLAHTVGAGKTLEMIAAMMELRRLGLARKPMAVVPNHLVGQWKDDFLRAYPGAQILVPTKKDIKKKNRMKLMSRIATGNYDAVIVGHKSFELLPVKDETFQAFMDEQIEAVTEAIAAAKAGMTDNEAYKDPTTKQLVRRKKQLEEKLKNRTSRDTKDKGVTFEELGVDQLVVDEAHAYKNLGYLTMMDRIAGLANSDANRSVDMLLKSQYISKLHGGQRGIVFATGTPVSNSVAEVWTMMRYLMPTFLEREGFDQFDAWAKTFGKAATKMEVAPEGGRFIARRRFSEFYNAAELMNMFRLVADIKTKNHLNLPTPAIYKGGPIDVVAPASESLKEFVKSIGERADAIRGGGVDPATDNMLKISSDARKASLDMRLVYPSAKTDPNGKVAKAIESVVSLYHEFAEYKAAQLMFLDLSTPKAEGTKKSAVKPGATLVANVDEEAPEDSDEENIYGEKEEEEPEEVETADEEKDRFTVYGQIRSTLIARGIKPEEIAFIHDAKTDDQKKTLFDRVNSGSVRVLIGSTEKMGAGMNAQERLIALHHLDAPWRPSDVEQRQGRIDRQGNQLWDKHQVPIRIYRYQTEGSFDSFMWQTILAKARPITQLMEGDPAIRRIEEMGPVVLSYEQAMAISAGNPMIREKIMLDQDINRMEVMRGAWMTEQSSIQRQMATVPAEIRSFEESIAALEADIETRDANPGVTVNGVTYTGEQIRKEAAPAIIAQLKKVGDLGKQVEIDSTFHGFQLLATPVTDNQEVRHSKDGNSYTRRDFERDGSKFAVYERVTGPIEKKGKSADYGFVEVPKALAEKIHAGWDSHAKGKFLLPGNLYIFIYTDRPSLSMRAKSATYTINENYESPAGTIASGDSKIRYFNDDLKHHEEQLKRLQRKKVELETKAGDGFADEEKLRGMRRRQAELEAILGEKKDDNQALVANEDDNESPIAKFLKDPTTSIDPKWLPVSKRFVESGAGVKAAVKVYAVNDNVGVTETKQGRQSLWRTVHIPTGREIGATQSEGYMAVAYARQLDKAMDLKFTTTPTDFAVNLRKFTNETFTPPTEVPEDSRKRIKAADDAALARKNAALARQNAVLNPQAALASRRVAIEADFTLQHVRELTRLIEEFADDDQVTIPLLQQLEEVFTSSSAEFQEDAIAEAKVEKDSPVNEWEREELIAGMTGAAKKARESSYGKLEKHDFRLFRMPEIEDGGIVIPESIAKPRPTSVTLGMGPGQEMYDRAAEATAKYIKDQTLPAVKKYLDEKGKMVRALIEILDPRWYTPRPIMDTVSQMAGGRSMAEYLVAKKLDNWSQKFSKMSRQDSINFVDRVKAGLPQPDDDLQDAADFMRRMDDQVWNSIPEDRRPAYLENHFRVMWKVIPDSNKAIAAREARAQELVDGMTDPTRQAYAQDYLAYITEQTPDEPEIPEGVQPAVARKIRLRIDKILQSKAGGTGYVGASRKNLRGTRSFLNQHTLESMSEGMEHGGEPVSYNPLLMFAAHYNDAVKYVTALRMIEKFKTDGTARTPNTARFLKSRKPMFDGYARLDDNAARVALKTPQGFVATGEWVFERNAANLLNNMLGRDYLREVYEDAPKSRFFGRAGRSLLNIKNAYTAIELGWSPYHAVFEGIEAVGSMMGIGLRESYNTGIVPLVSFALGIPTDVGVTSKTQAIRNVAKGVGTIATSPWAFVSAAQEGARARRGWTEEVIGAVDNVKPKLFDKLLPEVAVDYLMARRAERAMKKTVAGRQFVKNNPAAAQAIPYYFIGGGKLGLPEEFETHGAEELQRHWNDMLDKQRTGNQRVSSGFRAGLKALPASSQYMLKPLFQNYIPNLKLAFFLREFGLAQVERAGELERGEITLDQIARLVVGSVENRFGEMNFDRLFWDRTIKTFLQILFRSVTWKIGELSELGRAFGGQGKEIRRTAGKGRIPRLDPSMGWLAGVALAAALVGTVLTYVTTGHPPKDMQGLLYPVIDDATGLTVALPSYIRNYFHMWHDPAGYVKSSFQGELGKVMDLIGNQDWRHQKIWQDDDPMYQQSVDSMLHLLPEPITSGGIKKIRQGDTKEGIASMLAFSKAPAYIDKTPAELLAQDIAGQHRSVGGRSRAAADKAEAASRIRRAYKAGNPKAAEELIAKQVAAGVISQSDGHTYKKQAGRSPLDAMVKQFSMPEALRVYDKAEDDEKKTLEPIVKKKVFNAKNNHPAEFGDPGSNTWNLATKHFGVKPPPAARQGQVTQ